MTRFEFSTAGRIVFGPGSLKELPAMVAGWGRRALVVTGHDPTRASRALSLLSDAGIHVTSFAVAGEPTVAVALAGTTLAREAGAEFVVGFGGGSALDTAKAIAGLLTNPGDPLTYLEVVGQGQPLRNPAAPWIAIPTTAGTGAEVTRNAVLAVPEQRVKVSLRSPHLLARVALVDPELTLGLPPAVTATTGLDALTQLIEARVSSKATPFTNALCERAIAAAAAALVRLADVPDDLSARTALSYASLTSGLALANAGLGVVHGFAAVLGGMYPLSHGHICAALLAPVMCANIRALEERAPGHPAMAAYESIARSVTGRGAAAAGEGAAWVAELVGRLPVARLGSAGVSLADEATILERTLRASSTQGNPLPLTRAELAEILRAAL